MRENAEGKSGVFQRSQAHKSAKLGTFTVSCNQHLEISREKGAERAKISGENVKTERGVNSDLGTTSIS